MTDKERIREVLDRFEYTGLILGDSEKVLECFAEALVGIGLGEQGVVRTKADIRQVIESFRKEDNDTSHTFRCENVEILLHSELFASLCAEVIVAANTDRGPLESHFYQSLTLHKLEGDWKICALHASTPILSEESIEAYPLKFAEKTLESLRKRIGEEVYLAEEQYRKAVLADTIAFYIINLTVDEFEKCQLNGDVCANVPLGTSMQQFMENNVAFYVEKADQDDFLRTFSHENIERAYADGRTELACEYRLKVKGGGHFWAVSILRLITDAESGDRKGIMYVRDISQTKQERAELLDKATRDSMTQLYNSAAFTGAVDQLLDSAIFGGALVMLDADDFKSVNDTYGHPVGDEVLNSIARTIKNACSTTTWAGRLGGDEFAIFAPCGADNGEWARQLEELRRSIADIRLLDEPELRVSCSIGVAYRQEKDRCFKDIYEKADKALYYSKHNRKGQITVYDPAICR